MLLLPLAADPAATIQIYDESNGLPQSDWHSSLEDQNQTIWTAAAGPIIYSRKQGDSEFRPDEELHNASAWRGLFRGNPVGRVMFRSHDMFALEINGRMRKFELKSISSSARAITAAYCDSKDNLWVSDDSGVIRRILGSGYVSIWSTEHGLRGVIFDLRQSPSGAIWAGGSQGLFYLQPGAAAWRHVPLPFRQAAGVHVTDFQADNPIVYSTGKGAFLVDSRTFRATAWRPEMQIPATAWTSPWLARAFDNPLNSLRGAWRGPAGPAAVELPTPNSGLRSYTRDREGRVWLATLAGLFAVNPDGSFRHFTQTDGLIQTALQTIATGPDGELWVGYDFPVGFSRFDLPTGPAGPATRLRAVHSLPGQGFAQFGTMFFGQDTFRQVWRGTDKGILVTDDPTSRAVPWFPVHSEDGWSATDTVVNSFLLAKDGAVWFSTVAGVIRIARGGYKLQRRRPVKLSIDKSPEPRPDGRLQLSFTTHPASELRRVKFEYRFPDRGAAWASADTASFPVTIDGRKLEVRVRESEWHRPENTISLDVSRAYISSWSRWYGGSAVVAAILAAGVFTRRRRSAAARYRQQKQAFLAASQQSDPAAFSPPPPAWGPGSLIHSRYQIDAILAQSNFSDVYGATDTSSGASVVLKRLRPPDYRGDLTPAWFRRRFTQEVAAMGMVRHPGILTLLETWIDDQGIPHLVMPRIFGPTLRNYIDERGRLPLAAAGCLIEDVAATLGAAHEQGVVHCDIKPENIMLRPNEHRPVFPHDTFVIDFGTSAVHLQSSILSQSSRPAGTAGYMAPEQILGRYSTATDVYSFAILSFEILTGEKYAALHLPFDEQWEPELSAALLRFGLPAATAPVFAHGLCFDPNRRASNIREWAAALLTAASN